MAVVGLDSARNMLRMGSALASGGDLGAAATDELDSLLATARSDRGENRPGRGFAVAVLATSVMGVFGATAALVLAGSHGAGMRGLGRDKAAVLQRDEGSEPVTAATKRIATFDMSVWNCRGRCPLGGCCTEEDCTWACSDSPRCVSLAWDEHTQNCALFGRPAESADFWFWPGAKVKTVTQPEETEHQRSAEAPAPGTPAPRMTLAPLALAPRVATTMPTPEAPAPSPTSATNSSTTTPVKSSTTPAAVSTPDPADCADNGQDCTQARCCKAQGMQCYQKSKYWSNCQATCVPGDDMMCTELGGRAPKKVTCTWAGEDCTSTRQCCNPGAKCIRMNEQQAFCVGHPEAGWNGEVIGGPRFPWNIGPAPPGKPVEGTRLYCIMGYLPGSAEEGLVNAIRGAHGSIFQCDGNDIFQTASVQFIHQGSWNSLVNTDVFVTLWKQVQARGNYKDYDWTVKVDPDTVFMPGRLRWHLGNARPPAKFPMYIRNDHGILPFLGAIEIVSEAGLDRFFDSIDDCHRTMGGHSGEDGFIRGCFDMIGVAFMMDDNMLVSSYTKPCTDGGKVAYHPRKSVGDWMNCFKQMGGR
mmetsp:Transcript_70413/g.204182  ORF Transcript_70413/g.204182 Transcript_70413/m.204182 type:complete len:584 (+) Transcript_70413:2-1753(+)